MDNEKTAVIDFFCGITPQSAQTLVSVVNNAIENQASKIIIRLSSRGGDLAPSFGAYHFLRSTGIPLSVCNFGNIESSAVLLYLAADTRTAVAHSQFLIHPFHWTFPPGPVRVPAIKEAVASLDFDAGRYADIFNERTSGAEKRIDILKCLEGNPLVIGAQEALLCGITTVDPAEQAFPAGALRAWIVEP
ncbi:MAG: ATP-dependent Clp protease proteolytic subunit [Treponema sp.]|nr:ATP-dependent Clp protease proteolytic subunit [Treponema sp.]